MIKNTAKWLFIICLPFLLVSASVSWAVNSSWLYQNGFEKYDISRSTGIEPAELKKAADGLIRYFNSGDEFISLQIKKTGELFTLFNEREVQHLNDVKGLFQMVYWVLLVAVIYSVLYIGVNILWWRDWRRLIKGLMYGSGLTLAIMVLLGLGVMLDFSWLFRQFHLISFTNDLWLLDPTRDYLIMLFPLGFWFDVSVYCALATVAGAVILGGVGWLFNCRLNRVAG